MKNLKRYIGLAKKTGSPVILCDPHGEDLVLMGIEHYEALLSLEKEQEELRDTFMKLHGRGCYVMLSNSDTPFINKLYSGLGKKITISKVFAGRNVNSNAKKRGKIRELVAINY